MATPMRGACFVIESPPTDEGLMAHMQYSVTMWNADPAAVEQLAGREASILPEPSHFKALFSQLEFVNRDVAHASRRHQCP